jgi:hypothetical protein
VGAAKEELPAIPASGSEGKSRHRANYTVSWQLAAISYHVIYPLRFTTARVLIGVAINKTNQLAKRRIVVTATIVYFLIVKTEVIMFGSSLNNVVVGGVSLYDNLSGFSPTPRPAGNLAQELKSALTTSKIRKIKASIGVDYPGQGHLRQVQPFGYHLGANKHVRLVVTKIL